MPPSTPIRVRLTGERGGRAGIITHTRRLRMRRLASAAGRPYLRGSTLQADKNRSEVWTFVPATCGSAGAAVPALLSGLAVNQRESPSSS
jgi:hypothetical protein